MVGTEMNREIEEYMVYCYSRQLSKKTMANYEQSLRLFEKWCGNAMKIDDAALVTEAVIRRYINYIRNLRAFFNWLEQECVLRKNPMKRIKQLKNSRRPKEYITNEDFKKLAGVLDKSYFSEHRDYAAIVLMLDSGMRLGECLCLTVDDVHLTKR